MNAARAVWSGEPVRLDRALAELGLARSRSHAAELIARGRVRCDGSSAAKAGARVSTGTALEVEAGGRRRMVEVVALPFA